MYRKLARCSCTRSEGVDLKLVRPQLTRAPGQCASDGSRNYITDQIWNNFDVDDQLYP